MFKHIFLLLSFVMCTLQAALNDKQQQKYIDHFEKIYTIQFEAVKEDLKNLISLNSIEDLEKNIKENKDDNTKFLLKNDNTRFEHHEDNLNVMNNVKKTIKKLGIHPTQLSLVFNTEYPSNASSLYRIDPENNKSYLPSIFINPYKFINSPSFMQRHVITHETTHIKRGDSIVDGWLGRTLGLQKQLLENKKNKQKLNLLQEIIADLYYAVTYKESAIDALKTNFFEFDNAEYNSIWILEQCVNIMKICTDIWNIDVEKIIQKEEMLSKDVYKKFLNAYAEYYAQNIESDFQIFPH